MRQMILALTASLFTGAIMCDEFFLISVPIASVRIRPEKFDPLQNYDRATLSQPAFFGRYVDLALQLAPPFRDPIQDTQVLYANRVKCLSTLEGWLYVELVEQIDFNTDHKPVPIKGYIQANEAVEVSSFPPANIVLKNTWVPLYQQPEDQVPCLRLPMGVALPGKPVNEQWIALLLIDGKTVYVRSSDCNEYSTQPLMPESIIRSRILECAYQFLDKPYCWGGCSPYDETGTFAQSGVDCSGFIYLIHRASGYEIGIRNSRSQYNACIKKEHGSQLKPGDCIFFAPSDNPSRIIHIMLYVGNNQVIDTALSRKKAILSDGLSRFGCTFETMQSGQQASNYVFYFGSFIG